MEVVTHLYINHFFIKSFYGFIRSYGAALFTGVRDAKMRMSYFNVMFALYTLVKIVTAAFEVAKEMYQSHPTIQEGLDQVPIFDLLIKSCVDDYGFQWW